MSDLRVRCTRFASTALLASLAGATAYAQPAAPHRVAQFGYTEAQAAALDAYRERNIATARRALRAGVRFAMGSDAAFTMFGQNTREVGWFVKIGMTPAQALATATTTGAALLGKEKELGAVAPATSPTSSQWRATPSPTSG